MTLPRRSWAMGERAQSDRVRGFQGTPAIFSAWWGGSPKEREGLQAFRTSTSADPDVDGWAACLPFKKGSPPYNLPKRTAGTPWRSSVKLLGSAVAFLQDNAEHILGAAAVGVRFFLESVQQLAFNPYGLPVLGHLLFLLHDVYLYAKVSNNFKYLHMELRII